MTAAPMITLKLRYLQSDIDQHGNARLYFRRSGCPKVRIREAPGTEAFLKRYHELLCASETGKLVVVSDGRPKPGTYRWLCCGYLGSKTYGRLEPSTQRTRRLILESTYGEPAFPGSAETFADLPLGRVTTKILRVLRDRKNTPDGGNNRVKAIKAVFKWALEEDYISANPARDLLKVRVVTDGHHTWTVEEIEQFKRRHPIGTKAHLALALLMFTGVRRSDVVQLCKQHVRDGWLHFKQHKNRNRYPVEMQIPILPELQAVIDASQSGDLLFLVTEHGKPFSIAGFGNKMRQWCNEAGLPHCSAHGLRKSGAAFAAEQGATPHQLMAMFGWDTMN